MENPHLCWGHLHRHLLRGHALRAHVPAAAASESLKVQAAVAAPWRSSSSWGYCCEETTWTPALERSSDSSIATLGHFLLTKYSLIFELISLLLLVAMLGAIVTARGGRSSKAR